MSKKIKKKKNKKISIILFLLIIICLLTFGYCFYNIYKQKITDKNSIKVIFNNVLETEINSEVYLKDYVKEIVNGKLVNGDEIIDTSKLGIKELNLFIKNKDGNEEKYNFKVTIIDSINPIIDASKELTSYIGNSIDLLKDVKVSDNSNEEISAKVVGEYDPNKVGKYDLKYEALDSSGNKEEYDFILNIVSDPNNRTFTTSKGFNGKVINGITYIDGILIANKTYSLPSSYAPGLQSSIQNAFNKLKNDATSLGYNFYIGSGYRSYWTQQSIYNNYVSWDGQAQADTYSARPGHSEHQSGLAIDVCDSNVSACVDSAFDNTPSAKWLNDNCYKYGLIVRYPYGKSDLTGYMYESWHLRYVGEELATKLYNDGNWITIEEYYGIDSKYS